MTQRLILFGLWLLCLACSAVSLIWSLTAVIFGPARAMNIILGYDLLGNATLGNAHGEYISSMATKAAYRRRTWWAVWLCRMLEAVDPGHCGKSLVLDRGEILSVSEVADIRGGWKP